MHSIDSTSSARASRVPLLLNMARCTLKLHDMPATVDYATQALRLDPDSTKALYRRAMALAAQA